jgi:hypothetical protein
MWVARALGLPRATGERPHAAAAPPSSVINSRRLMHCPQAEERTPTIAQARYLAIECLAVRQGRSNPDARHDAQDERRSDARPMLAAAGEFEAVQTLLKTCSPALTAPRIVSGPTLLTGICFCAACGKAKAGCLGRTVPMDKLDRQRTSVCD